MSHRSVQPNRNELTREQTNAGVNSVVRAFSQRDVGMKDNLGPGDGKRSIVEEIMREQGLIK